MVDVYAWCTIIANFRSLAGLHLLAHVKFSTRGGSLVVVFVVLGRGRHRLFPLGPRPMEGWILIDVTKHGISPMSED